MKVIPLCDAHFTVSRKPGQTTDDWTQSMLAAVEQIVKVCPYRVGWRLVTTHAVLWGKDILHVAGPLQCANYADTLKMALDSAVVQCIQTVEKRKLDVLLMWLEWRPATEYEIAEAERQSELQLKPEVST